jgi:hypothetical protein
MLCQTSTQGNLLNSIIFLQPSETKGPNPKVSQPSHTLFQERKSKGPTPQGQQPKLDVFGFYHEKNNNVMPFLAFLCGQIYNFLTTIFMDFNEYRALLEKEL